MARTMKKFSKGGAQGMYDRRMADIEKDRKIALAKGKNADVVEAKAAQRKADAEDDRAKRMGLDRTATRKAEYDAEQRLSRTRKFGADKPAAAAEPAKTTAPAAAATPEPAKAKPKTFGETFKAERARLGAGKTFTYNGKSFTTNIAGEGRKPSTSSTNSSASASAAPTRVQRNYNISPENRAAIDAAAKKEPFTKTDSRAVADLKAMQARRNGTPPPPPPPPADPKQVAYEKYINDRDKELGKSLAVLNPFGNAKARADDYNAKLKAAGKLAKGGKINKKEKTMKYRSGGSTPPKPPQPSAADRARSKAQLDSLKKAKPTAAEGKVAGSANRSEGPGYKKGGKAKGKGSFMATKFGAALMKKSADTKGRAMKKFAKGGSIDGCAVKGKTKTKRVTMKNGGSC